MNDPLIGIVIVNFNGSGYQNECIRSVLDSGYENFRIIIVDNGSTDDSVQRLDEFSDSRLTVTLNGENYGIAKGNNIGIAKSMELGCEYTLLLNNDTVVTKNFLRKLLVSGEMITCPKIYYHNSDKILWYGGGKFINGKGFSKHMNFGKKDEGLHFDVYYAYAPTCCLLIRNEVFADIGMMDEKYFLYYDDTDFMLRANRAGYRVRLCEDCAIYHKVSMSTGRAGSRLSVYYVNRNRFYYIRKNKLGMLPMIYSYISRFFKILASKFKKTSEWKYIKEAICDYKNGRMYEKDLSVIEEKYR